MTDPATSVVRFSGALGDVDVSRAGDLLTVVFAWSDGGAPTTFRIRGREADEVNRRIRTVELEQLGSTTGGS